MSARERQEPEPALESDRAQHEHLETDGIPLPRVGASGIDETARYGSLGIQFAGTILLFGALGYWADRSFDTLPWFLLTGLVLGSVGGFISLVKKVPAPRRGADPKEPAPRRRGAEPESRRDSGTDPSDTR